MGVFVIKNKKANFRVIIEEWVPKRKTVTVKPENYPTYNIHDRMTYEQADSAAKEYNIKNKIQKNKDAQVILQAQEKALLNEFYLNNLLMDLSKS